MPINDDRSQNKYLDSVQNLSEQLQNIDIKLLDAKSKFTEKDKLIKILLNKRSQLAQILKNRTLGYLKVRRIASQSIMEAATRPKGVILNYKKLLREAARDENTLIALENQLRGLNLEEAKLSDPWELITEPTLNLNPVGPNKTYFSFVGILLGFIFALFYCKFKEKESDLIFENNDLESILNTKIIDNYNLFNKSFDNYDPKVLFKEILGINSKEKFYFIWTENLRNEFIESFKNLTKSFYIDNNISFDENTLFTNDLSLVDSESNVILLTSLNH